MCIIYHSLTVVLPNNREGIVRYLGRSNVCSVRRIYMCVHTQMARTMFNQHCADAIQILLTFNLSPITSKMSPLTID